MPGQPAGAKAPAWCQILRGPSRLPEDGSYRATHGERGLRKELDGEFLPDIAMSLVNTALQPESPDACTPSPASSGVAPALRGEIAVALPMRHAGVRQVTLRYEVQGPAQAPVVFVAGGISAHRHVAANALDATPGRAPGLLDAGRLLVP